MADLWVVLYFEGETEPVGRPIKIRPIPEDVDALAEAVKVKRAVSLSHCDAAILRVYAPRTQPYQFSTLDPLQGDMSSSEIEALQATYKDPLIVVAPVPPAAAAARQCNTPLSIENGERLQFKERNSKDICCNTNSEEQIDGYAEFAGEGCFLAKQAVDFTAH